MVTTNALTDHNYRELTKALDALAYGYSLIEKAEKAGVNMDEFRNHYDNVREAILNKKRVFWPDRP